MRDNLIVLPIKVVPNNLINLHFFIFSMDKSLCTELFLQKSYRPLTWDRSHVDPDVKKNEEKNPDPTPL